jgi:L-malate glycosyltransferase
MKLLVIGHSYATAFAQEKFAMMKELDPSLRLCIVVPPNVSYFSRTQAAERHPALSEEIAVIRSLAGKPPSTYLPNPLHLIRTVRTFSPDVVLIEEDPHSVVGTEACIVMRIFCPSAKLAFFSWDNLARRPKFPLSVIKRLLTKFAFAKTSLIICGNSEAQRLLGSSKNYLGSSVVLPQVGIAPFGVGRTGESNHRPVIGFVGRLVPEKGLILLLEVLSDLRHLNWELTVVGSGSLAPELRSRWQAVFGDRLTLKGPVSHVDVPDCLRALDIFVLPSQSTPTWKEQFGLTLAQAMMAGVACIGSSSGAIPEVLGDAGLIFEEGSHTHLKDALETLITLPDRRYEFAAAGRRRAIEEFSTSIVAGRYLAALKRTVDSSKLTASPQMRFSGAS